MDGWVVCVCVCVCVLSSSTTTTTTLSKVSPLLSKRSTLTPCTRYLSADYTPLHPVQGLLSSFLDIHLGTLHWNSPSFIPPLSSPRARGAAVLASQPSLREHGGGGPPPTCTPRTLLGLVHRLMVGALDADPRRHVVRRW